MLRSGAGGLPPKVKPVGCVDCEFFEICPNQVLEFLSSRPIPASMIPLSGDKVSLLTDDGRTLSGLTVHERHFDLGREASCRIYLVDQSKFPPLPPEGEEWKS